jgi:hypothetical protein
MTLPQSRAEQLQAFITEIDALRDAMRERRARSPYPWDPTPVAEFNALLDRARAVLPEPPVDLPEPLPEPGPSGQHLWRTPTDDALQALENLRAAIATALKAGC